MTLSEIHTIMTNGFATVAGSTLIIYTYYGVSTNAICRTKLKLYICYMYVDALHYILHIVAYFKFHLANELLYYAISMCS